MIKVTELTIADIEAGIAFLEANPERHVKNEMSCLVNGHMSFCAYGAIVVSNTIRNGRVKSYDDNKFNVLNFDYQSSPNHVQVRSDWFYEYVADKVGCYTSIPHYNDTKGITVSDVISTLKGYVAWLKETNPNLSVKDKK